MGVAGDDQTSADARGSACEVLVEVEAGAAIHLEQRTGSRRGLEDPRPVETQWVAAVDDPAGRGGPGVDVPVLHPGEGTTGELVAGVTSPGMDAGGHDVQTRQPRARVNHRGVRA